MIEQRFFPWSRFEILELAAGLERGEQPAREIEPADFVRIGGMESGMHREERAAVLCSDGQAKKLIRLPRCSSTCLTLDPAALTPNRPEMSP